MSDSSCPSETAEVTICRWETKRFWVIRCITRPATASAAPASSTAAVRGIREMVSTSHCSGVAVPIGVA